MLVGGSSGLRSALEIVLCPRARNLPVPTRVGPRLTAGTRQCIELLYAATAGGHQAVDPGSELSTRSSRAGTALRPPTPSPPVAASVLRSGMLLPVGRWALTGTEIRYAAVGGPVSLLPRGGRGAGMLAMLLRVCAYASSTGMRASDYATMRLCVCA
eukprot:490424-Rhodomonas_salina.3